MNSIREEALNESDDDEEIKDPRKLKRRSYKTQTLKTDPKNLETFYNKVGKIKQRYSISITYSHRMNII